MYAQSSRRDITQYANIIPSAEAQKEIDKDKYRTAIERLKKQHLQETNALREQINSIQSQKNVSQKEEIELLQSKLSSTEKNYSDNKTELVKQLNELTGKHDRLFEKQATLNREFNKSKSERDKCIVEKSKIEQELQLTTTKLEKVEKDLSKSLKELTTEKSKKSTEVINNRRINELEADIKKLKNTETQLNVYLERLSNEYQKLQQKLEKLESEKVEAEDKIEFQKAALSTANSELKARDSQILERDNRIGLLEKQTEAILKKCQGQKQELELEYKKSIKLLKSSSSYSESKVVELQQAKLKLEKELEEKDILLKEYEDNYKQLQKEIERIRNVTNLEGSYYENEQNKIIKGLRDQVEILTKSNEETENTLSNIRFQLKTCNSSNEALKGNLTQCTKEKESFVKQLEECRKERENVVEQLNEQIAGLKEQLINDKKRKDEILSQLKAKISNLESEKGYSENLKQKLKEQTEKFNSERKGLEEKINIKVEELTKLSQKYSSLEEKLINNVRIKEREIELLNIKLNASEKRLNTCNSSNATLKTEKEKLNNELETCRKQRETVENLLNERITNLNTELGNLRSEKQYLEQSRTDFKLKSKDRLGYEQGQFNEQLRKLNETIRLKDEEISNVKEKLENLLQEYNKKESQLLSEIERKNSEIEQLEGRLQASEFSLKTERGENLRLLDRIEQLNIAKEKAEKVSKGLSDDKIELQKGITSRHSEIEILKMELRTVKDKLQGLESSPNVDFDAYNQGMTQGREQGMTQGREEAKQNYINRINELQSIISQFEIDKERMEFQFKECSSVNEELRKKIQDLETLVKNLSLENNRLKDKLSTESNKLTKEREMYDSQYKENQKLLSEKQMHAEAYNRLDILWQKALSKKTELEEENKRKLEEITMLKERLKASENALQENKRRLVQPVINEVDRKLQERNMYLQQQNDSLYAEIRRMQQELKLKEENIRQTSSQKAKLMEADEARLLSILRELESGIVLGTNRLTEITNTIDRQERIIQDRQRQIGSITSSVGKSSVLNGFSLSSSTMGLSNEVTSDQYDKIQRIIRNVEKVTKKSDKLFQLSKGK